MYISSMANDRVKELNKLIKTSKARKQAGCFIVEGIRMFKEIPTERLIDIYVSESSYEAYEEVINQKGKEAIVLADKVYKEISDTGTPQGIMATVRTLEYGLDDIIGANEKPFLFIAERLQDPGNLGTILRTAEGAGVTGIILSYDSVDLYNPKTVRSTMGSIFRVPVYISGNLEEDIRLVKDKGVVVYGAHLDGTNIYDNSFLDGCAFLIGNEGNGLSDEISDTADKLIRIPMEGRVESLNAAISATVIGYEVLRQRKYN